MAVWIRIPGVPREFYTHKDLWRMGNMVGRTLRIDENSLRISGQGQLEEITDRGRFARICVEIDLGKSLLSKFRIGQRQLYIGYEGLYLICFLCGQYGHRRDQCSFNSANMKKAEGGASEEATCHHKVQAQEGTNQGKDVERSQEVDGFGPLEEDNGGGSPNPTVAQLGLEGSKGKSVGDSGNQKRVQGGRKKKNNGDSVLYLQAKGGEVSKPIKKGGNSLSIGQTKRVFKVQVGREAILVNKYPNLVGNRGEKAASSCMDPGEGGSDGPNSSRVDITTLQKSGLKEKPLDGGDGGKLVIPDVREAMVLDDITNATGGRPRTSELVGVGKKGFSTLIKDLVYQNMIQVLVLLETKISGSKADRIARSLEEDHQYVHTKLCWLGSGDEEQITFVYGSPRWLERKVLWENLGRIAGYEDGKWAIMGDFNAYVEQGDKQGGAVVNWGSVQDFVDYLSDCGLSDLGYTGPKFTWRRGGLQERLDRLVVNDNWLLEYPNRSISYIHFHGSDHRPIVLKDDLLDGDSGGIKPFRFMTAWMIVGSFNDVVVDYWDRNANWNSAKEKFKVEASIWHKNEELTWYQRSRSNWLAFGDRNSKFYHSATKARARRNKIRALRKEDGSWEENLEELKILVIKFFKDLYMEDCQVLQSGSVVNYFPVIDNYLWRRIGDIPSREEIRSTFFKMQPYKAPGADGLHAVFLHTQWDKVGESVTNFIIQIFEDPRKVESINQTLICLIPKIDNPELVSQFRPISLCNVIYKGVTKLVASRLRNHMSAIIMPNQCSFVKGRHASDNIIISQEIFHSMRSKKGKKGWMAVKVDLEKAYDRVSWSFLEETLVLIGMASSLVELIMACVTTSSINILWNGSPTEEFSPVREIIQGDPLSPYLFVLCIERMGHLINSAVERKDWKPVKLGKQGPPISHLFFADDLLIFSEANRDQANLISNILNRFCLASGQKISYSKTKCCFSRNVNHTKRRQLSSIMSFDISVDLGKYLGVPVLHNMVNKHTFSYTLDRTNGRLKAWKEKTTKSVLAAMPTYSMQTALLPLGTCYAIEKKMRGFVWGSNMGRRKIHVTPWDVICRSKNDGGLGIRKLRLMNKACLMKIGHGILTHKNDLWVRVLKNKYKVGDGLIMNLPRRSGGSNLWIGLARVWPMVYEGSRIMVGNGNESSFWDDKWLEIGPLRDHTIQEILVEFLEAKVVDMVNANGEWRWQDFSPLLN
ncbi:uncharacterized protein LOC133307381 [Gastrolobium bilobum]|uniref:uncharacterized protein LOC133307381 n=1 Tax=Gastrolobium bilobum TaxID=150636 RepID=UPI002AAF5706|nr:uncharacterized protein LOC133307381 [Gastrolobium bilobum]